MYDSPFNKYNFNSFLIWNFCIYKSVNIQVSLFQNLLGYTDQYDELCISFFVLILSSMLLSCKNLSKYRLVFHTLYLFNDLIILFWFLFDNIFYNAALRNITSSSQMHS